MMPYRPYIPQNIGELLDKVRSMMPGSPTFKDKTGYLPEQNIDTTFYAFNEGLSVVRKKLGEERYAQLREMSERMRELFESDPDDTNGDAKAGRAIIRNIEDILIGVARRRTRRGEE